MAGFRFSNLGARMMVLLLALMFAASAGAADRDGWYLRAQGGGNFAQSDTISGDSFYRKSDFVAGYLAGVAVGYDFSGWRLEGEYLYRQNDIDSLLTGPGGADGHRSIDTWMANIVYDFYRAEIAPIGYHLGMGFGLADISFNDVTQGGVLLIDDSDNVFAWQAIGGISYQLTPRLSANIDYRYLRTAAARLAVIAGGTVKSDVEDHSVLFGITWHFGVPQAAPAPAAPSVMPVAASAPVPAAPAAAPAPEKKTFLVFFDWDKSDIRPDTAAILTEATATAKGGTPTVIRLVGHADRSGLRPYNQKLSERRALAVKDFLIGQGLPADAIATLGKGEDDPLVATPDGVREPRNRRVEIALP